MTSSHLPCPAAGSGQLQDLGAAVTLWSCCYKLPPVQQPGRDAGFTYSPPPVLGPGHTQLTPILVPLSIPNHLVTSRLEPRCPLGRTFSLATLSAPNSPCSTLHPHPTRPAAGSAAPAAASDPLGGLKRAPPHLRPSAHDPRQYPAHTYTRAGRAVDAGLSPREEGAASFSNPGGRRVRQPLSHIYPCSSQPEAESYPRRSPNEIYTLVTPHEHGLRKGVARKTPELGCVTPPPTSLPVITRKSEPAA